METINKTKKTEQNTGIITKEHPDDFIEFKRAVSKYESKYRHLIRGGITQKHNGEWHLDFILDLHNSSSSSID